MGIKLWIQNGDYSNLTKWITENNYRKILVVCGKSMSQLPVSEYLNDLAYRFSLSVEYFRDFEPNPKYESIVKGVRLYKDSECDLIVGVGGGSAMDVAKCIKLFATMDDSINYLEQKIVPNNIGLILIPTTAGTGSEATHFAVIYYQGEKKSVADMTCLPDVAVLDSNLLKNLPLLHRKSTMLDALCHAMESYWSVKSNDESKTYALEAMQIVKMYYNDYLSDNDIGNQKMLEAADIAGEAINITQTTAGHAMSYKLTSLYGIPHGSAAALCVNQLLSFMPNNIEKCIDSRGQEYLKRMFEELSLGMGFSSIEELSNWFDGLVCDLDVGESIVDTHMTDIDVLINSVNIERLKNNPVELSTHDIESIYRNIICR